MFFRILLSALLLVFTSIGSAHAFNTSSVVQNESVLGSCTLQIVNNQNTAQISYYPVPEFEVTGGTYWEAEGRDGPIVIRIADKLDKSQIATCIGGGATVDDLKNFSSTGADSDSSYVDQDYMGLKFKIFDVDYEFALSGATTTVAIITNPPLPERPTAPTAEIGELAGPTDGKYTATITLSQDSDDFAVAALALVNAAATLTGSGKEYTVTLTPEADGELSVQVKADSFSNTDGTKNTDASNTQTADYTYVAPPTAFITNLVPNGSGQYDALIQLSEASPDFDVDSLTLVNATATVTKVNETFYTLLLTPIDYGEVSVQVKIDGFSNEAGIKNAEPSNIAKADYVAPTAAISELAGPTDGKYTATITLSQDSDDFAVAALTLDNATAALAGSGKDYTVTLTPKADGEVSVQVKADSFSNADGTKNVEPSNIAKADYDGSTPDVIAPTAAIGELAGPTDGKYTAAITLSQDSDDFAVAALTLDNATATLAGSGKDYTVTLTPKADGEVSVQVKADSFSNADGTKNVEPSNIAKADYEAPTTATAPDVAISGAPASYTYGQNFDITAKFSQAVTGFEASDMVAENATVSNFSGSGDTYTMSITPTGNGNIKLQVPAGAANNSDGTPNIASEQVNVKGTVVEKTQEVAANFIVNRARALIANQPNLTNLLNGGAGSLSGGGNDDGGNLNFVSDPNKPIWLRVGASWSKNNDTKSNYVFGAGGLHYKFSPNFLAGVMVEFDHINSNNNQSNISGTGWLAGPYAVAKLPDHPLYFDARVLWGKSKNEISPYGTYKDEFDTTRLLARVKISGDLVYNSFIVTPNVIGTYTTDKHDSYTDGLGNSIASQKINLGEISAGVDFSIPIELEMGKLNLMAGFDAIYSHSSASGFLANTLGASNGYRARVDLGVDYDINEFVSFDFNTFYDGIGSSNQSTYGLDAGLRVKF